MAVLIRRGSHHDGNVITMRPSRQDQSELHARRPAMPTGRLVLVAVAAFCGIVGCAPRGVIPAPSAAGTAGTAGAGAAGVAAPPYNLWTFLLPPVQMKQEFCACICASPIGRIANNMLKPVSLFSGGLVPEICPDPNAPKPGDLAKPADSAEGAAARIKQSEAEAAARRAAMQYLGTVDCKRFPEAEAALIGALLSDTSECVRLAAALALGSGCCCTEATMKALMQSVSGKAESDPPERSMRVRAAAAVALQSCLSRCEDDSCLVPRRPESPLPPEKPLPGDTSPVEVIPTPAPLSAVEPRAQAKPLLAQARQVLAEYHAGSTLPLAPRRQAPTPMPIASPRPSTPASDGMNTWAMQPSLLGEEPPADPPSSFSGFLPDPDDRPAEVRDMERTFHSPERNLR